ncbi:MAG: hypothetical protein DHS20C02_08910 [Micavibrio sp.]|nr:MAG: hypothetical protein DHS20C02_08910 [Micavibrio sp.]
MKASAIPKDKFSDPVVTAKGEKRAWVDLTALKTLWFNTGTLCNLTCANCYIESSPKNDALVYLTHEEVCTYLDEIERGNIPTEEIGITGGEPFMNPDILKIIEECLQRGFKLLVLTNAMLPMQRKKNSDPLLKIKDQYGDQMTIRVSVDHFNKDMHEEERGKQSWAPMIKGLKWLSDNEFTIDIAGRTRWGEKEEKLRDGFAVLFKEMGIVIDAYNKRELVLFPEMDETAEVQEITTKCWDILGVHPDEMMCSSSRMVVKRKGAYKPAVLACTLLAYDSAFELGTTLKEANKPVPLNHPHCAKFCVLGGGSCSVTD